MDASVTPDDRFSPGAPRVDGSLPRWQRWLLPAIVGAEDAARDAHGGTTLPRSVRDWLVDFTLFGFALMVGVGSLVADHHNHVSSTLFAIDVVLTVPACLLLWVRRRYPVAVGWLAVGALVCSGGACGAGLVALFTVAVHCAPRRAFQLAALSGVAGGVDAALYTNGDYNFGKFAFWLVLTIAVVGFGLYVRVRRELLLSLRERARRAEDEQQLRVHDAQLAERARIAREMHDVLAHRISLLSVHAGALEFNPGASPQEIARAASVIRVSARAAQEDLREVIGVLRADVESEDPQPPQPTIADLKRLLDESHGAGMNVSLLNRLEGVPLSPVLGRTVYRLVQEALTNVRKHAPGQVATITIGGDRKAGIQIEIANRPRVGEATAGGVAAGAGNLPNAQEGGHVGSGMGLVGLAERVSLIGGQLAAEPLPGGGFRLAATLPWSDPEPLETEPDRAHETTA